MLQPSDTFVAITTPATFLLESKIPFNLPLLFPVLTLWAEGSSVITVSLKEVTTIAGSENPLMDGVYERALWTSTATLSAPASFSMPNPIHPLSSSDKPVTRRLELSLTATAGTVRGLLTIRGLVESSFRNDPSLVSLS